MMRKARVLAVFAGLLLTRGVFLPGCASADGEGEGEEAEGRFAQSAEAGPMLPGDGGAGDETDACADAWPPCSYIQDGGPGADLDAASEAPKDGGTSCNYPGTCQNANDLGSICADDGSATKTYTGTSSMWLGIKGTECDHGVRANGSALTATLDVPDGTNFDLYVYADTGSGGVTCTKLARKSTNTGAANEAISIQWGESGFLANGDQNDVTFRFEVRHVSGTCATAAKWTLKIEGNK